MLNATSNTNALATPLNFRSRLDGRGARARLGPAASRAAAGSFYDQGTRGPANGGRQGFGRLGVSVQVGQVGVAVRVMLLHLGSVPLKSTAVATRFAGAWVDGLGDVDTLVEAQSPLLSLIDRGQARRRLGELDVPTVARVESIHTAAVAAYVEPNRTAAVKACVKLSRTVAIAARVEATAAVDSATAALLTHCCHGQDTGSFEDGSRWHSAKVGRNIFGYGH